MSKARNRKPLNDALAQEFVYGQTPPAAAPPETAPSAKTHQEPSLMNKLLETAPKEATVRLTVDLPESMHRKLSLLSARTGKKKAVIVRLLLEAALQDVTD